MNKFVIGLAALAVLASALLGCDSVPLVSQVEPTPTSSRTPRPTFTPKPRATATVEEVEPTEEPEPTEQVEPTEEPTAEPEPPTPTPVPPTRGPTRPPPPTEPPPPPEPTYRVTASSQYFCPQDGIFEVMVNAKSGTPGNRTWAIGYWFGAFAPSGQLLQDGAGKPLLKATEPESLSYGSNCQREFDRTSPDLQNGKLDVGDAVRAGTNQMIIRFVNSPDDLTPISPDFPVEFGSGGRWWFYLEVK